MLKSKSENLSQQHVSQVKEQRGFIDGAFDLVHSGHFNAIRQGKALSPWLVAGVNADSEILKAKGPTVLKE